MEKLTIKPWQVMQAHENGAKIEMDLELAWLTETDPTWNWNDYNFRIANLTSDGMRLDELVEKYPDCVRLEKSEHFDGLHETSELIKTLITEPSFIFEIKVKQERKLRPWTMEEFEKHRDEWLCNKHVAGKYRILSIHENGVFIGRTGKVSYVYLLNNYTSEDGSPCGVLE